MTAVTFLRVRDRLNKSGLQLELYAEPDGFRWDIASKPLRMRRVFPSVQAALEHADKYTHLWYEEKDEASGRRPTGQFETALLQSAATRLPTSDPVRRHPTHRLDPRLRARKRSSTSS